MDTSTFASSGLNCESPPVISIFVSGDSTSGLNPPSNKTGKKVSWADLFGGWFNEPQAIYRNEARPGYSLRDYFHRGILDEIFKKTTCNDIILACHGHLEGAPLIRADCRARGSLPGAGDETQIVYDAFFQREDIVHTFGWYLKSYYQKCDEHGVKIVFLSPPVRCIWAGGKIRRNQSSVTACIMQYVCGALGAIYFDFASATESYLNDLGPERGRLLYMSDDQVHTNAKGAATFANLLANSLLRRHPEVFTGLLKSNPQGG